MGKTLYPTPCPQEKLFQPTLIRIQIIPTEELAMKSFALLTTVSLISLSTLATVRPVMALESRQPDETRIAQGNNQDAIGHYNRGVDYIQQEKYDLALAEFTKAININPRLLGQSGASLPTTGETRPRLNFRGKRNPTANTSIRLIRRSLQIGRAHV